MGDTAFGNYVLGLAGLNALRRWHHNDGARERERLVELATSYATNDVLQFHFNTPEHAPAEGYSLWAETYDGDNPMIAAEQSVVNPLLAEAFQPGAVALDAGCGTGRHAQTLVELGYSVIGTDLTPAMLDIAQDKVPSADFRQGSFNALPVQDNSIDLVTSALAVCHAPDLEPVFAEFARVLRPGGRIVISDPHPTTELLGGQAFFQGENGDLPYVRNYPHQVSDYVSAMVGAGFQINALTELPYDDAVIQMNPGYAFYPEAVAGGLTGVPFVLIWQAMLTA